MQRIETSFKHVMLEYTFNSLLKFALPSFLLDNTFGYITYAFYDIWYSPLFDTVVLGKVNVSDIATWRVVNRLTVFREHCPNTFCSRYSYFVCRIPLVSLQYHLNFKKNISFFVCLPQLTFWHLAGLCLFDHRPYSTQVKF